MGKIYQSNIPVCNKILCFRLCVRYIQPVVVFIFSVVVIAACKQCMYVVVAV